MKRLRKGYKNDFFSPQIRHIFKTTLLKAKVFCESLDLYLLRIRASFYENPTVLIKYPKTHFDSKLVVFKKIPLLTLAKYNKACCITLFNGNKAFRIK